MALREGMVEGGHSTQHEPLRAAAQVLAAMIRVRIRVRREILTCPIRGSNSVDGVYDFEKVPPDQLCPRAKRDLGLGLGLGLASTSCCTQVLAAMVRYTWCPSTSRKGCAGKSCDAELGLVSVRRLQWIEQDEGSRGGCN